MKKTYLLVSLALLGFSTHAQVPAIVGEQDGQPDHLGAKRIRDCVNILLKANFVWAERKQGWYCR